jgi:CheY-like chemotaxis protein
MRHDLARAYTAGFQRHVSKPFSLIALSAAAETVLGLEKKPREESLTLDWDFHRAAIH